MDIKKGGMISEVKNIDCMEYMAGFPDKFFELAIVDPPYFSGPEKRKYYGCEVNKLNIRRKNYRVLPGWAVPNQTYFDELYRVSKHQIIWGCNYYQTIYPTPGRIIWDKVNDSSSFSDCEIASCSLIDTVRIFRFMWNGMMQGKSIVEGHIMQGNKKLNEKRIHTTQKPVALYKWLLNKYAEAGWKILDTHLGSGSHRIAAYDLGFDFYASELDPGAFVDQDERFKQHTAQQLLFTPNKISA